ncbi:MAG: hypothetical protein O8C64_02395 [Candidatus Methanoperedens sp.]|nr:hypothetical protein [Candidatus Methanoperedens sp.]
MGVYGGFPALNDALEWRKTAAREKAHPIDIVLRSSGSNGILLLRGAPGISSFNHSSYEFVLVRC